MDDYGEAVEIVCVVMMAAVVVAVVDDVVS